MFPSKFLILSVSLCLGTFVECTNNLGQDFGNFAEAIGNLFAAADDCKYKCPNGAQPVTNPNHRPSANGCGSYGIKFKMDAVPGATDCCDKHDYCYDTCNSDKSQCDKRLNHCLQHICYDIEDIGLSEHRVKECKTMVQYIYGGVSAIGCDAYMTSQKAACSCPKQKDSRRSQHTHPHNDI